MDGEVIAQATGTNARPRLAAQAKPWLVRPMRRARAPQRMLSGSRLIVVIAVVAMGATLVCAAIGYSLAERSDQRVWAEQRAALRNAIAEFRVLFGRPGAVDPRFVRMVEQSARLKGLKFEIDPAPGAREMQPVLDAQGRIAGFFTWDRTYPMTATMNRLMPLIGGIALVLVGFAGFALRQLKRARADLAASEEAARRAADADKLTGLPNHAKTLELLDLALAERAGDEVVSFALIELDGMADVNAQLGVLGADEFVIAVARRLREALPDDAVCGRIGGDEFAVLLSAPPRSTYGRHPRGDRRRSRARIGSTAWCG